MDQSVRAGGAGARKDALIAAARRRFVAHGYDGTSLDDVIAEAGGSRRNIYAEFGGKAGLLNAVMARIIAEIAEAGEETIDARGDGPIRDWLVAIGVTLNNAMLRPDVIAVFRQFIANGGGGPEADRLWRDGPDQLRAAVAAGLARHAAAGWIDLDDADFAAIALTDMMRGSLQLEVLAGRRQSVPDDEITHHVERTVDLFLRAVRPA